MYPKIWARGALSCLRPYPSQHCEGTLHGIKLCFDGATGSTQSRFYTTILHKEQKQVPERFMRSGAFLCGYFSFDSRIGWCRKV